MYEYFCPLTGRGIGGDDFSWTAAIWLHWLRGVERDSSLTGQGTRP
jgi:hypothetical protein